MTQGLPLLSRDRRQEAFSAQGIRSFIIYAISHLLCSPLLLPSTCCHRMAPLATAALNSALPNTSQNPVFPTITKHTSTEGETGTQAVAPLQPSVSRRLDDRSLTARVACQLACYMERGAFLSLNDSVGEATEQFSASSTLVQCGRPAPSAPLGNFAAFFAAAGAWHPL